MCLKLLCFGRKSSIFDGKMTPEMCLTSSCSRQKHHLKMCRKNGGFTGFPTVKKSEDLFFKKREKGKEDERRLKTPPQKKETSWSIQASVFLLPILMNLPVAAGPVIPEIMGTDSMGLPKWPFLTRW